MFIDYHVHSQYSDGSDYVVKDAIEMSLEEKCFTDHVNDGVKVDVREKPLKYYKGQPFTNVDYPKYFKELKYLQNNYKNQISIKKGLEFVMQKHTIDKFQKLFDAYPLDFVIISIHQINDQEFWINEYEKDKTVQEAYDGYYDELYQIKKNYDDYSCLVYFDSMRRYVS